MTAEGKTLDPGSLALTSFGSGLNVAIAGAAGGLGSALVDLLSRHQEVRRIFAMARTEPRPDIARTLWVPIDIEDESSIRAAASMVEEQTDALHLVIVATGILHDGDTLRPEKSWRALAPRSLETAFRINTIGPTLVAKHFLPLLARRPKSAFAVLSARVGSISDNRLGGWHAYRASKAALNMMIRSLSIELERVNPNALCVALHPGTVDTGLSKPFQPNVPEGKLFTPAFAAGRLLTVLDDLSPERTGRLFAWDGAEIPF